MPDTGGVIYAIGAEGSPLVKIGYAKTSAEKRLKTLQTGQPFPLHLIAAIEVQEHAQTIEKRIHAFLTEVHRRGEWFEIAMDVSMLQEFIAKALQEMLEQARMTNAHESSSLYLCNGDAVTQRIERVRLTRGLSLKTLSLQSGVSLATLSALRTGQRQGANLTLETGIRLAQVLGCSIDYLSGVYAGNAFELSPP